MSNLYDIQFECVGGTRLELATYSFAEEKNLTTNTMKKKIKNTQLFDNCHRSTPELTALVPLHPHRLDG
jgi:hypothetical protein